jgi:Polyglycine hydrolase-like, structural repeat
MQFRTRIQILFVGVLAAAVPFGSTRIAAQEKEAIVKLEWKDGQTQVTAALTKDDAKDKDRGAVCKIYSVELKARKAYQIDMVRKAPKSWFDPYLRLETSEGREVTKDDDSGGFLNARIVYEPERDGKYRIIATTYLVGPLKATGDFTLTVRPVRAIEEVLKGQTPEEHEKAFRKHRYSWYPTRLKGYVQGTQVRYDVTWKKVQGKRWYLYVGMSAENFARRKEELKTKDFDLAVESSWEVDGVSRYAGIWYAK